MNWDHIISLNINKVEGNNIWENVQQQEQLTGQVNNQAQTVDDIVSEAVNQPTAEEQKHERLREILRKTRIRTDTEVPPQEYTLQVDETGFFAKHDIHAVKAKAKAGKTTTLKVLIAALLMGEMFRVKTKLEKPHIVYFDTEQNRNDTQKILTDVAQMTELAPDVINSQVALQSLRRVDREDLLPLLCQALEDEKPDVVFIDGIVEFVTSFNDETESKQIIKNLLVLCEEYDCAIVCVLHTNKAEEDHQMRGHLGTMLAQKAGTVLECKKERGSSVITVSCSESRHEEPTEWSIMFAEGGRIVDATEQCRLIKEQRKAEQLQKRLEASEKEKQERLQKCLTVLRDKGGAVSRKQLTEILVNILDRKRPTVASYISGWLKDKAIFEDSSGMIQASTEFALAF